MFGELAPQCHQPSRAIQSNVWPTLCDVADGTQSVGTQEHRRSETVDLRTGADESLFQLPWDRCALSRSSASRSEALHCLQVITGRSQWEAIPHMRSTPFCQLKDRFGGETAGEAWLRSLSYSGNLIHIFMTLTGTSGTGRSSKNCIFQDFALHSQNPGSPQRHRLSSTT